MCLKRWALLVFPPTYWTSIIDADWLVCRISELLASVGELRMLRVLGLGNSSSLLRKRSFIYSGAPMLHVTIGFNCLCLHRTSKYVWRSHFLDGLGHGGMQEPDRYVSILKCALMVVT